MATSQYTFDLNYQKDILRLCVQDPVFLRTNPEGVIVPNYFTAENLKIIARVIAEFFKKNLEVPKEGTLRTHLGEYLRTFPVSETMQSLVYDTVTDIYSSAVYNKKDVEESACFFAQKQSIRGAIEKSIGMLEENEKLSEIPKIITESSLVGMRKKEGINFFNSLEGFNDMLLEDGNYDERTKIPTPFPTINQATFGGMGKGNLWVLAAKNKMGKSSLSTFIAAQTLRMGKIVYHYSFGDMSEVDVMMKYIMSLSGQTVEEIRTSKNYQKSCREVLAYQPGAFLDIIYESPNKWDTDDLYNDLCFRTAKNENKPDIILVDYVNQLKKKDFNNTYGSIGLHTAGLKEIADAFDCTVFTLTQLNRHASREAADSDDVSESAKVGMDCDVMMILNQSEEQAAQNRCSLSLPLVRRGSSIPNLQLYINRTTCQFREQQ